MRLGWSGWFLIGLSPLSAQVSGPLKISPTQLSFVATADAEAPPPQAVAVVTADGSSFDFQIEADAGAPATAPPAWLRLSLRRASTPARFSVGVSAEGLEPGEYGPARLFINNSRGQPVGGPIPVTLKVVRRSPELAVEPPALRFQARIGGPMTLEQPLLVRNAGSGGLVRERITLTSSEPWLRAATEFCEGECLVRVTAAIQGMTAGSYRAVLRVATGIGSRELPVALHLADRGPWLEVNPPAVEFQARAGHGSPEERRIRILNTGEGKLTWNAQVLAGGQWLLAEGSGGAATADGPGLLRLRVNPGTLTPGVHYALVRIASPEAANSPVHLIAVLSLSPSEARPVPLLSEAGYLFVGQVGAPSPEAQTLSVMASSAAAVPYQGSAHMWQATSWLSVTPGRTEISTTMPARVLVAAAGGLPPGLYRGSAVVNLGDGTPRAAAVAYIVRPPEPERCSPSTLVIVPIGLPDGFEVRTTVAAPLAVRVADDCGNPAQDALAMAVFSNGDPAVPLRQTGDGVYTGVWTPGAPGAPIAVGFRAWSLGLPGLGVSRWDVTGAAIEHRGPALASFGVLDNLNPQIGGSLAPGAIVQIYGSNLAPAAAQPPLVGGRLPVRHDGVSVLIGGLEAPLYYVSGRQINAQVPVELLAGRQYQAVVARGSAFTLPEPVHLSLVRPSVAAHPDGHAIAQDAQFRLIDLNYPAHPGDYLVIYLSGMGLTSPMVASGLPAPRWPLARCVFAPQVTLDGRAVEVLFAGLTPDAVGLYQVNFRVPLEARAGDLRLVVTQEGVRSNEVLVPVR